ncbi:FimV/HubP family polar landmark protein [Pseudomonas benzenivorans]|uniref:FimV family protein n=1 Tax=Pseudomonas benzenivorans TaxID=556533 RepID=A0ABY5HDQ4_9PSED|nr:FimV/HubP family polar landmark protein [Pseudomonas benzenivorans]UTW09967.1 FimV family protein [Pseudomonas benzenivorans]
MVRVRKLVLAIAAASALSSGMAHALGLGEVTLQSALNQPLVAEIELLEVRDLASNEVLPTLAAPEEFSKAGVDRQYFLTDLKFTPVLKPNGKSVIRVTSSKPVREPYLNFLVEVLWPNGRLLREYTLLLDPPLYSPQTAVAAAPQLPAAAPRQQPAAAPRPAAPVAAPSVPSAPSAGAAGQYKTTSNDTLWEIAQRVPGGTVHQAMLAIQDLNPDAFIGGNINRMKSGQVLRLPDEQQVKRRSQAEAIAQVASQNAAWREGRNVAARQLDATKRSAAGAAPAQVKAQDSLKLVSADTGKASGGSDRGAADGKALADKLAVTQESLDSTRRENDELKGRMGDLQGQLDKLQRLIQLKDDQLAKLQADLARQGQAQPAPTASVDPVVPVEEAAQAESTPAAVAQPGAVATPPVVPTEAETDYNYSEEAPAEPGAAAQPDVQQPAPEPAVAVEPVAPAPVVAEPAPVVEEPVAATPVVTEQPQSSTLDDLLAKPMLLGLVGGGALLVLLLGLMMLSRRNAQREAELQAGLAAESDANDFEADMQLESDSFETFAEAPAEELSGAAAAPAEERERVTAQTADALGEADIYIAYGRFNQAAELLQNAINDEPQRADLRLKLMEVHAELGDKEGFARQDNELREIGGAAAEVDQLKARYPAMAGFAGAAVAATEFAGGDDDLGGFSLDELTLDEPEQPAAATDLDDEFDLSLDDLESELDRDLQSAAATDSLLDEGDLSLDEGLEFDAPAAPSASKDDDLGFDLSLDEAGEESLELGGELADFSLDLESEDKAAAAEEEEFLLSLEDDEPSPAAAADELAELSLDVPEDAASDDFDLSADFDLSLDDEQAPARSDDFAAQLDEVSAELDQLSSSIDQPAAADESAEPAPLAALEGDDDFDFLSGTDETATKLDLARAYIDMGDTEGARDILDEVIAEGNDDQQQEAQELIAKLV